MAPGQRSSAKNVDEGADIYSTGATLYALLTAQTPGDLFAADLDPTLLEGIPPDLVNVIRTATRYHRGERFEDAQRMIDALKETTQAGASQNHLVSTDGGSHETVFKDEPAARVEMAIGDELRVDNTVHDVSPVSDPRVYLFGALTFAAVIIAIWVAVALIDDDVIPAEQIDVVDDLRGPEMNLGVDVPVPMEVPSEPVAAPPVPIAGPPVERKPDPVTPPTTPGPHHEAAVAPPSEEGSAQRPVVAPTAPDPSPPRVVEQPPTVVNPPQVQPEQSREMDAPASNAPRVEDVITARPQPAPDAAQTEPVIEPRMNEPMQPRLSESDTDARVNPRIEPSQTDSEEDGSVDPRIRPEDDGPEDPLTPVIKPVEVDNEASLDTEDPSDDDGFE